MINSLQVSSPQNPVLVNNEYIAAIVTGRPLVAMTSGERKSLLSDCIAVALFIGGWNAKSDDDMLLIILSLMPDINTKFVGFTDLEVKAAFSDGAKGNFGENQGGLSVARALHWLNAHMTAGERLKAKKELLNASTKKIPPPFGRFEKRLSIDAAYARFLKENTYEDLGNFIYDLLDAERLITFSNDQKKAFVDRGRRMIFERIQAPINKRERFEAAKKIEALMDNDTEPKIAGKKLALLSYFGSLKTAGHQQIIFCLDCLRLPKV